MTSSDISDTRIIASAQKYPKAAAQELSIKSIWFEFLEAQNPIDCFDSNSDVVFELQTPLLINALHDRPP